MFSFNDGFYFKVFKPVARGYGAVVPEIYRIGVHNFFDNLLMPIRLVNGLLQAKPKTAGIELTRFVLNSSFGLVGFIDLAGNNGLKTNDEDFGQTLGVWRMGHGFYFTWPFLGPSSLRDTVGMAGDYFLYPPTYLYMVHPAAPFGTQVFSYTNEGSLRIGEYESLIEAAVDPYVALRDAYYQLRKKEVEE
jgi:phospholipid-binding lipoprotein MlaA